MTADNARRAGGLVQVTELPKGRFAQRITFGDHTLVADEPRPSGDNTGPSPYDLLLAALGACTSMTVRMYADRGGWPLIRVTTILRHARIYADDCVNCETEMGKIDQIDREFRETYSHVADEVEARLLDQLQARWEKAVANAACKHDTTWRDAATKA